MEVKLIGIKEDTAMKHVISTILVLSVLIGTSLMIATCGIEDVAPDDVLQPKEFTLIVQAEKSNPSLTKALSLTNGTLRAYWNGGEQVKVYDGEALLGTLTASGSGASVTFSGKVKGEVNVGDVLTLKYLSPDYANQDGTLESIATTCDYSEATVTVSTVTSNSITTGVATFESKQAIVRFTLNNTAGAAISATSLTVTANGSTYTITPSSAASVLFVAIPGISSKDISLNATVDGNTYYYDKSSVTFANDKYYSITVKMQRAGNIVFADPAVKAICVSSGYGTNWDTNGDGELSYAEAAAVTGPFYSNFMENTEITSFNEFQYFTGITSIPDWTFAECSNLAEISIPNGVTRIGDWAFALCSNLTNITLPSELTSIGSAAFQYTGLTSIMIPAKVQWIGIVEAFSYTPDLASIAVSPDNPYFDSRNNCNAIIDSEENILWVGCKNTVIPNNVTEILDYAFEGCSGLTSITIPSSVTTIHAYAFQDCTGLEEIRMLSTTPPTSSSAFDNTNNCPIKVPDESINAYKTSWSSYASRIQGTLTPVDLGLSVKWADMNLYAASSSKAGGYFTWDEIHNYSTNNGWRLPTKAEMAELLNSCTVSRTTENGVSGYSFTNNGATIFLPDVGGYLDGSFYPFTSMGAFYWTSTPDGNNSGYRLRWTSSESPSIVTGGTEYKFPVRLVKNN
ncbi:MAG: leucine-rich repeat protein [Bacteroidales bacterium]|nr:leucine-rich repeat protein [Bacteroidales bacterium]